MGIGILARLCPVILRTLESFIDRVTFHSELLVAPPRVFEPTGRMPPGRIAVRPVDDSALRAGLVLAVKRHRVSLS